LEERLGHRFDDGSLLEQALIHRSSAHEEGSDRHYERLEFLGDAVLGLVTAEWLFCRRADDAEGALARTKSYIVSAPALAGYARSLGVGDLLRLSVGEERTGGRDKLSLLADALEALFGAAFLDGGYEAARSAVVRYLEWIEMDASATSRQDAKTALQEWLQANGQPLPVYRLVDERGPDHAKRFVVECWVGKRLHGSGSGPSKKQAEQEAAAEALAERAD
jgi:ribonuclease-3